jgi:hypothetical protein
VKYGTKEDRRQWLKLHLMVGTKTNIVTSVEVSDGYAHDYPFFKGLVDRTADAGFKMKRDSLHSVQVKLFAALSQAIQHRNHVSHDQVEIRSAPAKSNAHGAD